MKPNFSVKEISSNLSNLSKAMRALTAQDVFIGVPADEDARKEAGDTGISNAYLAYIHNTGVPEKGIPARPSLVPGIEDIQKDAIEILEGAAKSALEGKVGAVEKALKKIGLLGQRAVQARFADNDWDPLKDSTLDARKKISEATNKKGELVKKYGKSRREKGRVNPLLDTAQLRDAQTYVVRKKGNAALIIK